jgi:hypothetical protein
MKVLTNEQNAVLTEKATNWDKIILHYVEGNPEAKAEDVTPDSLFEAFANENDSEMQSRLESAQAQIEVLLSEKTTMEKEIDELQTQVNNLLAGAGAKVVAVQSETEPNAKEETLAEFAQKNSGDTFAILEMAKKEGLI